MTNVHPSHCSLVFGFVAKYISARKNSFGVNTFLQSASKNNSSGKWYQCDFHTANYTTSKWSQAAK